MIRSLNINTFLKIVNFQADYGMYTTVLLIKRYFYLFLKFTVTSLSECLSLFRIDLNKIEIMFPLTTTKPGEKVHICTLSCSMEEAKRLRELGCVEGICAAIVSNQSNVILQVGETKLAINGNLARTILVKTP
jgi:Fe2+ transport system protein FeoA